VYLYDDAKQWLHKNAFNNKIAILVGVISSLISSILFVSLDIFNHDGMLYLETSEIFLSKGMSAAFINYDWPFFSIITAYISIFFHTSVVTAFYIQSCFFLGFLGYFFIKISQILFNHKETIIIASIIFLSATTLNNYRTQIIRDHGFWMLTFAGVYYFLRAIKEHHAASILYFCIYLGASTIFRVEGVINLISFPIICLIYYFTGKLSPDNKNKVKQILMISLATIFLIVFFMFFSFDKNKISNDILTYINMDSSINKFILSVQVIKTILPKFSHDSAGFFLFTGISTILIIKTIFSMGTCYSLLALLNIKQFLLWYRKNTSFILLTGVFFLPLIVFTYTNYFLSSRYAINLSLLLLFPLIACLSDILLGKTKSTLKLLTIFIIFAAAFDGFYGYKHTDKSYYKTSIHWINTQLPVDSKVITNNQQLNFLLNGRYSRYKPFDLLQIKNTDANYLLLDLRKENTKQIEYLLSGKWQPIKEFINNKKDKIIIFSKLGHNTNDKTHI